MGSVIEELLEAKLKKISLDKTSGSNQILIEILEASIDYFNSAGASFIYFQSELAKYTETFGSFISFQNFYKSLIKEVDPEDLNSITYWLKNYLQRIQSFPLKAAVYLNELLPSDKKIVVKIFTLSHSLSIANVLGQLSKSRKIEVFQAESRPVLEGHVQAQELAEMGLKVKVIVDAFIAKTIQDVDIVLLGADGIYSKGFVNKSGSLTAALAAQEYEKALVVIADKTKIKVGLPEEERPKPTEEISSDLDDRIEAVNYYFELVPHKYVTNYILDSGVKKAADLFK